jgi:hypothetical protein
MRIYEGSPRQEFEEVLRSIGAVLDARVLRECLLLEVPDGFIVQGVATEAEGVSLRSERLGRETKVTLTFVDDDVARFLEEARSRRGSGATTPEWGRAGYYEKALRVIGRYLDEQKPRDIFFLEQDGAFVVRILPSGPVTGAHQIIEFTREDIEDLIARGPALRAADAADAAGNAGRA